VSQVQLRGYQNCGIHRETGTVYYTVSSTTTPASFEVQTGNVFSSRLSNITALYELSRCKGLRIQFWNSAGSADVIMSYTPYIDFTPPTSFTQVSEQPVTAYCLAGIAVPGALVISRRSLNVNPLKWYHTRQLSGELTVQGLVYYCSSSNITLKMKIDYMYEFCVPVYPGTESKKEKVPEDAPNVQLVNTYVDSNPSAPIFDRGINFINSGFQGITFDEIKTPE